MSKQSWYGGDTPSPFVGKKEIKTKSWYTGSSVSLVVTFLLGVGVGFFMRYAWFELRHEQIEEPATPTGIMETVPADSSDAAAPGAGIPDLDVTILPANMEESWPAQHLIVGLPGTVLDPDSVEMLNRYKPGGVWLRSTNTVNDVQIGKLIDQINLLAALEPASAAMPLVVAGQDGGAGGNVLRLPEAPTLEAIAQLETLEAIREAGKKTAAHALNLGVGMLLTPVLDVYDASERHASERPDFLGTTPESVTRAGIAYIEGLQEQGALAVAKHYPGIGSATIKEGGLPLIKEDDADNLTATIQVFADAAANDVAGILISGATIPVLDTEIPGRPTSLSPAMVRGVLRQRCGFDGVLIAEDMRSIALWSENTTAQNIVAALAAGCDAVLLSSVSSEEMAEIIGVIKQAVEDGTLDSEELQVSRQRLDLCRVKLARTMGRDAWDTGEEPVITEGEGGEDVRPSAEGAPEPEGEAPSEAEPAPGLEEQPEKITDESPDTKTEESPAAEPRSAAPAAEKPNLPEGTQKIVHTIKQGETLTGIADAYGVSVRDIVQWNNLKDTNIKFGDKVDVYTGRTPEPETVSSEEKAPEETTANVPEPMAAPEETAPVLEESPPAQEASPSPPEASAPITEEEAPNESESAVSPTEEPPVAPEETVPITEEVSTGSAEVPVAEEASPPEGTRKVVHTIKQGETLTGIANSFGVSVRDIVRWNNLEDTNIKFGRKVDVYTASGDGPEPEEKLPSSEKKEPETAPEEIPGPVDALTAAPEEPAATAQEASPASAEVSVAPAASSRDAAEAFIGGDNEYPPADVFPEDMPNAENPPEILPLETPAPEFSSEPTSDAPAQSVPPILPAGETAGIAAERALETAQPEMTVTEIPAVSSPVLDPDDLKNLPESPEEPPVLSDVGNESALVDPAVSAAPSASESAGDGHKVHIVGPGDTLNKIAAKYGVTVQQLIAANTFDNPDILFEGHEVKVPNP